MPIKVFRSPADKTPLFGISFSHVQEDGQVTYFSGKESRHAFLPRAVTSCFIKNWEDGKIVAEGAAFCHMSDVFRKSTGRKIALRNALSTLPKEARKLIWEAYWNSGVRS